MSFDAEMMAIPPTADPVVRSAAAERMRRHRERRRDGLRCLLIELRETEIDSLIRTGLLRPEMRNDANAIIEALYAHFDRALEQEGTGLFESLPVAITTWRLPSGARPGAETALRHEAKDLQPAMCPD
jgi:hypothetical protein